MKVRRNSYGGFWVGEGTGDVWKPSDAIVIISDTGELYCWDCLAKVCVHVKAVGEFEATEEKGGDE